MIRKLLSLSFPSLGGGSDEHLAYFVGRGWGHHGKPFSVTVWWPSEIEGCKGSLNRAFQVCLQLIWHTTAYPELWNDIRKEAFF